MRITVLTQYYDPEPVPIPGQIARHLAAAGHDVRVVTGLPNYPEGRLYAGYLNRSHIEHGDGIPVHRVRSFLSHSSSGLGRVMSYGTFAVAAGVRVQKILRNSDVVYVYATQMTASIPALLARLSGAQVPYVLHIQDLWPESVTESSMLPAWLAGPARIAMRPWLALTYRRAASIIAIAPTMAHGLKERAGAAADVRLVYNWSGKTVNPTRPRDRRTPPGSLRVLYGGNLGDLQDLETVVEAVRQVARRRSVEWRIAGGGSAEVRIRAAAADLVDAGVVSFLGRLNQQELLRHEDWADAHIVPLKDLGIFRGTVPSKFQNAMASGIPVITTVPGDVTEIVSRHHLGLVAPPENASALAAAFDTLAEMPPAAYRAMSERCMSFYALSMSAESGLEQIEAILVSAATRQPRSTPSHPDPLGALHDQS
ncbi:glycosyltransferase family 4 protein [Micrococcus luteus]|uniref:glycosyltransferase family 4 protein n=1 Tax=Micrococcus luteus TaxID=1270 RepID=UPI0033EE88AA